jgi:hypothetical protein
MPKYTIYRFDKIKVGTISGDVGELVAALRAKSLLPESMRNVVPHCDYRNGNYLLYDPATDPETPVILLVEEKP